MGSTNIRLMVGHRLLRWPNIILALGDRLVSDEETVDVWGVYFIGGILTSCSVVSASFSPDWERKTAAKTNMWLVRQPNPSVMQA